TAFVSADGGFVRSPVDHAHHLSRPKAILTYFSSRSIPRYRRPHPLQPGAKISLLLGKGIHHHLPEVGGNLDKPLEHGFEQLAELVPVVVDGPAIHVAKEEKDVLLDALAIADLLVPRFPFLLAGGDFLELRGRFEPLDPLGGEAKVDP